MDDGKMGKGVFGSLLAGMGLASRPDMNAIGNSLAGFDAMQAQHSYQTAAAAMQAQGVGSLGMVPPLSRPSLSITDAEIAWVWKALPSGSVLYVAHSAPYVSIRGPDGNTGAWTDPARIPCLRAVVIHGGVPIEMQRAECEAAVKLLSMLAYGKPDALSVVVLERLA
jgi:hypothetical protein